MTPVKETVKETPEELAERLALEKQMRHESALASREFWRVRSKKEGRQNALALLEKQLKDDIKPIKGQHPFVSLEGDPVWSWNADKCIPTELQWDITKNKEGEEVSRKAVRLSFTQLSDRDIVRLNMQISSLKYKLGLN